MTIDDTIEGLIQVAYFVGVPIAYGFSFVTLGCGPIAGILSIPIAVIWPAAALIWLGASLA